MALKALDIFKLLPKTNCKKCGCPTCLAFAMKLVQKQAKLDECPDVTEEAKAALDGAAAPPIRLVTIGVGERALAIGNETVMFRHEETFHHAPGIGVLLSAALPPADLEARVEAVRKLQFVRVGTRIGVNIVGLDQGAAGAAAFAAATAKVVSLGLPLVLCGTAAALKAALPGCAAAKPLLHAADNGNWEALAALAKEHGCPLAVKAVDLDAAAALTAKLKGAGVEDLVLDVTGPTIADTLQGLDAVRRLALKKSQRALGYPCMTLACREPAILNVGECATSLAKYSALTLTVCDQPEEILPLLTISQNLYTDPRKPIQLAAGLYEVGAVDQNSPLLITTNFSLTYYTVEGEVEASRVPAYIGVINTDGTSVLTAFASDKLTAENVSGFLNSTAITEKLSHRKVIIPGYVAVMSGALKEESGWEVLVGPREASGLPKFLKTVWQK